jgi:hypothetical protein
MTPLPTFAYIFCCYVSHKFLYNDVCYNNEPYWPHIIFIYTVLLLVIKILFDLRTLKQTHLFINHLFIYLLTIGRTMSLHVSTHGAILRRYINNRILSPEDGSMSRNLYRHCTSNKLNYVQWYVCELIGILLCLTGNKAQYIVLIHNRMHSLKNSEDCQTGEAQVATARNHSKQESPCRKFSPSSKAQGGMEKQPKVAG